MSISELWDDLCEFWEDVWDFETMDPDDASSYDDDGHPDPYNKFAPDDAYFDPNTGEFYNEDHSPISEDDYNDLHGD